MPPTFELDATSGLHSWTGITTEDMFEGWDNNCAVYFGCSMPSPSPRTVIPEASDAFMQALGKLKTKGDKEDDKRSPDSLPDCASCQSSKSTNQKLRTRRSSLPSTSSSSTSSGSISTSLNSSSDEAEAGKSRFKDSKRAASFGGSDMMKSRRGCRSSQCEKHVSWADQCGEADHQLIRVRLIRPRLSADTSIGVNAVPGRSILREAGAK